jgi:hypothetical protein
MPSRTYIISHRSVSSRSPDHEPDLSDIVLVGKVRVDNMLSDGIWERKRGWIAIVVFVAFVVPILLLPTSSNALVFEDPLTSSSVKIRSGTGSFSVLSDDVKRVNVQPGATLSGTIRLDTYNGMDSAFVAPLIRTMSWGVHYASFEIIDPWIGTGSREHTFEISFTAPKTPGTYYLIFAFNAEYNGSEVASLTNWRYYDAQGGVSWDDGNDTADLSSSKIAEIPRSTIFSTGGHRAGPCRRTLSKL